MKGDQSAFKYFRFEARHAARLMIIHLISSNLLPGTVIPQPDQMMSRDQHKLCGCACHTKVLLGRHIDRQ